MRDGEVRYEAEGADGLYDRRLGRLGRLAARRAPADEVARVLELFDTRYWDLTAKHFHEKLVADHGFKRSYNWLRLSLQAHGRRRAAPRRGAHRRKRPRRALPGMMLHQDGSSHAWVPGRWWDLIVTMDDATSDIYSAFFVAEEGTMSSFQGVSEAIRAKGLFRSLYADRASHYWNTPEAGGKVDKDTPTQVGRALAQLGIESIPAYSPEARGRSGQAAGGAGGPQKKAVAIAVRNASGRRRWSKLAEWLAGQTGGSESGFLASDGAPQGSTLTGVMRCG